MATRATPGPAPLTSLSRAEFNAQTKALITKLTEADDSLAQILDLAAQAIDTLLPGSALEDNAERFEGSTTDYFALLNDVQLFLRSACFHLVHHAKRTPLTPAQTSAAFDPLRAATASKGHNLKPEDFTLGGASRASELIAEAKGSNSAAQGGTKEAPAAAPGPGDNADIQQPKLEGLPSDALLSLGALRIQHQAWTDLVSALEALQ
ncbi:hypothetical protein V8E36_009895 [Tilletia maclaganii]